MLMLSVLHNLLAQVLSRDLHTAVLLTPSGELVAYASEPQRPKDEIRVIVGLSGEVWQETKEEGVGMVDSELGRIMVLPVDERPQNGEPVFTDDYQPLMLLALNAVDTMEWEGLHGRGKVLAGHLAKSLGQFRDFIAVSKSTSSPPTAAASPAPRR